MIFKDEEVQTVQEPEPAHGSEDVTQIQMCSPHGSDMTD